MRKREEIDLGPPLKSCEETDPMVVGLRAHAKGCGICRYGIESHDYIGDVRLRDLCGQGLDVIRRTGKT